jgi:hypothetical protein
VEPGTTSCRRADWYPGALISSWYVPGGPTTEHTPFGAQLIVALMTPATVRRASEIGAPESLRVMLASMAIGGAHGGKNPQVAASLPQPSAAIASNGRISQRATRMDGSPQDE